MTIFAGLTQELKHRYDAPFIKTTSIHPSWAQTPLLQWEKEIRRLDVSIMTAEFVASNIAKAILSSRSGQVVLPDNLLMKVATGVRGLPLWVGELIRESSKEVTRGQNLLKSG